ncbi:translation initiation factor eIF 4e-like domain-containing protein [Flammula alnicola]|nr:translation initiation factor eIF 4e-like domain-containing protein [Flammula alnicola]
MKDSFGDGLVWRRRRSSLFFTTMSDNSTEPVAAPASSSSSTSTSKKTGGVRLPSLNQLAARINSNAAAANGGTAPALQPSTTSAPRPRLQAFALRTGSTTSVNTTTTADSMAHATSGTASIEGGGGDPLTAEKLEKLNQETADGSAAKVAAIPVVPEAPRKKVGYKNIPSLDAITARLAKARASQLSVDGSTMPPEPEMIEDPKTPGVPMKAPEHPLQFPWTIYHDTKAKFPFTPATAASGQGFNQPAPGAGVPQYEAGLTIIGEFDTVEEFCRYFNWLKPPSKLEKNSNYHIFKSGIKPMWEDPANAEGGKWVLTMKNNPALLDRCWSWLAMALVGEELEEGDEICGAVVSLRSKVDRIQVWTRSKDDVEKLNGIGKRLVKLLDVSEEDHIGLEFQFNSDDRPPPNKFLSIQSVPASSFRSSFQGPPGGAGVAGPTGVSALPVTSHTPATGPGAAFGGFGTGMGIGGQVWKAAGAKRA